MRAVVADYHLDRLALEKPNRRTEFACGVLLAQLGREQIAERARPALLGDQCFRNRLRGADHLGGRQRRIEVDEQVGAGHAADRVPVVDQAERFDRCADRGRDVDHDQADPRGQRATGDPFQVARAFGLELFAVPVEDDDAERLGALPGGAPDLAQRRVPGRHPVGVDAADVPGQFVEQILEPSRVVQRKRAGPAERVEVGEDRGELPDVPKVHAHRAGLERRQHPHEQVLHDRVDGGPGLRRGRDG